MTDKSALMCFTAIDWNIERYGKSMDLGWRFRNVKLETLKLYCEIFDYDRICASPEFICLVEESTNIRQPQLMTVFIEEAGSYSNRCLYIKSCLIVCLLSSLR